MRVIDLFSGIGGFSLGLEMAGMKTVAFCEIDPYCQKILKKHWPQVPIFNDVRRFSYDGSAELICGGYPCQPFSIAGKQKGEEDNRNLWPAMFDLIKKYRPRWVIGENVANHVNMGLDNVLSDLEREAYTTASFIIPACAADARHRRDRLWIVAHSNASKRGGECSRAGEYDPAVGRENVADTACERIQGFRAGGEQKSQAHAGSGLSLRSCEGGEYAQWEAEPRVGRVVDGVPDRVDRIRALGNAVVPQVVEIIGRAIMEVDNERQGS